MKKTIKEYWQLFVALLVIVITILVMCCSCSTPRDIEHIYHHDTVYKMVVDVQTNEVEKIVEKKVYVWWPLWVALGIVAVIVGGCFWLNHELNKMAKEED